MTRSANQGGNKKDWVELDDMSPEMQEQQAGRRVRRRGGKRSARPPADETNRVCVLFVNINPKRNLFPVFINLVQERLRSRFFAVASFLITFSFAAVVILPYFFSEPPDCSEVPVKDAAGIIADLWHKEALSAAKRMITGGTDDGGSAGGNGTDTGSGGFNGTSPAVNNGTDPSSGDGDGGDIPCYGRLCSDSIVALLCTQRNIVEGINVLEFVSWDLWLILINVGSLGLYFFNSGHIRPWRAAFPFFVSMSLALAMMVTPMFYIVGGFDRPAAQATMVLSCVALLNMCAVIAGVMQRLWWKLNRSRCKQDFKDAYASLEDAQVEHVRIRLLPAEVVTERAKAYHEDLPLTKARRWFGKWADARDPPSPSSQRATVNSPGGTEPGDGGGGVHAPTIASDSHVVDGYSNNDDNDNDSNDNNNNINDSNDDGDDRDQYHGKETIDRGGGAVVDHDDLDVEQGDLGDSDNESYSDSDSDSDSEDAAMDPVAMAKRFARTAIAAPKMGTVAGARMLAATDPGPSVSSYLNAHAQFRTSVRFQFAFFVTALLWVIVMLFGHTFVLYSKYSSDLTVRFLEGFEQFEKLVARDIRLVQNGVSDARSFLIFGLAAAESAGLDASAAAGGLDYLDFAIRFTPWLFTVPTGTIKLIALITRITIYTALSLSMATLLGVWFFYHRSYRRAVLRARVRGWTSVLRLVHGRKVGVQFPAYEVANFVGLQASVMLLSTVVYAVVIALVVTPFVLFFLGVLKITVSTVLLQFLGPLLVTRVVCLLLARFYASSHRTGDIAILRPFLLLDFVLLFTNMLGGWVLAVVRFGLALLRVLLVFSRLDLPLSGSHGSDPGYRSYVSLVRVESGIHGHPIASCFARWVAAGTKRRRRLVKVRSPKWGFGITTLRSVPVDPETGSQFGDPAEAVKRARRRTLRNKWWLAITLTHNPDLVQARGMAKGEKKKNAAVAKIRMPRTFAQILDDTRASASAIARLRYAVDMRSAAVKEDTELAERRLRSIQRANRAREKQSVGNNSSGNNNNNSSTQNAANKNTAAGQRKNQHSGINISHLSGAPSSMEDSAAESFSGRAIPLSPESQVSAARIAANSVDGSGLPTSILMTSSLANGFGDTSARAGLGTAGDKTKTTQSSQGDTGDGNAPAAGEGSFLETVKGVIKGTERKL